MQGPDKKSFFGFRWISHRDTEITSWWSGLGYALLVRGVNSFLKGYFIYTRNSGGLYVGAATFFGLLSAIPVLSAASFLLGYFQGDMSGAHEKFFSELQSLLPQSSQPLMGEVSKLTKNQIANTPLSFLNVLISLWATKGFFSTLMSGLTKVTNSWDEGGMLAENLRAIVAILAFVALMIVSLELRVDASVYQSLSSLLAPDSLIQALLRKIFQWYVPALLMNTLVVTILYQWTLRTSLFNCFEGALTFIIGFLGLKTFYWVYLHYYEASTHALFGTFAPLVVGILWAHFAMTLFFLGACVASIPQQETLLAKIPRFERVR
jgi:uncharacterized BrkB/YihY/UPF0761 family membrane protein